MRVLPLLSSIPAWARNSSSKASSKARIRSARRQHRCRRGRRKGPRPPASAAGLQQGQGAARGRRKQASGGRPALHPRIAAHRGKRQHHLAKHRCYRTRKTGACRGVGSGGFLWTKGRLASTAWIHDQMLQLRRWRALLPAGPLRRQRVAPGQGPQCQRGCSSHIHHIRRASKHSGAGKSTAAPTCGRQAGAARPQRRARAHDH